MFKIEQEYKKIIETEFPPVPQNDELYDLFSELVELDGFVMGTVLSFIKQGSLNMNIINCGDEFNRLLSDIHIKSKELDLLVDYKQKLDKLIHLCEQKSKILYDNDLRNNE
ncbi:MAG: hypothetical protein J6M14_08100 [Campylobacter sp.]|uniref:hypothetical protein n=1 Tax=Campylobacter sp. JMF_08 NE1 TaxID=2983821 RepID=UPI001B4AB3BE|nr:hypothetical protein [Campylobacter sp. JMF_08 NE1]MBP3225251.1 hypothetical protein [Campylobacter sp.]MDA3047760.1 hypothetical protein [Campylobacter sp. JMF_08 NE1]